MKNSFIIILLLVSTLSYATIYHVGSSQNYQSPNALYNANILQDGDTVEIDAENYTGNNCLAAWQNNNLLIKGVGGRPHLFADGEYIMGKGIWVLSGNDITVENIEFSGAIVPDHNGAGIRLDGLGMTVRNCYFHDNEEGILTSNPYSGNILIEFSEFDHNGYSDGYSHNLYIGHVGKLTFRFNYSHNAMIGHNLKSRADENIILYNRIMDEETGNSSRLIDLPNGGFSIIMGNLLMQGNNAENNNMLGYGLEGLSNSLSEVYIINNTFVNKRAASCLFVDIKAGTTIANVSNNIFAGTGTLQTENMTSSETNLVEQTISNLYFTDEPNYDYHLSQNSPAIDFGSVMPPANSYSLIPDAVYVNPTDSAIRTIDNGIIDAGAYEFYLNSGIIQFQNSTSLYPNPANDFIKIESDGFITEIQLYNEYGQLLAKYHNRNIINLSHQTKGLYILKFNTNDGKCFLKKIIHM